jgi:RAB protein geranylgeranyltransferase component A
MDTIFSITNVRLDENGEMIVELNDGDIILNNVTFTKCSLFEKTETKNRMNFDDPVEFIASIKSDPSMMKRCKEYTDVYEKKFKNPSYEELQQKMKNSSNRKKVASEHLDNIIKYMSERSEFMGGSNEQKEDS